MGKRKKRKGQKKRGKTYPRQTSTHHNKNIIIPSTADLVVKHDHGHYTLWSQGKKLDCGEISETITFHGHSKEHVVTKATNLKDGIGKAAYWLTQFDAFYAVDTNTITLPDGVNKCSVGIAYSASKTMVDDHQVSLQLSPYMIFQWKWHGSYNIETVSWMQAIKQIMKDTKESIRTAVVVDSDLGKLELYNERKIPIFDSWYLPENFSLIYASSDYNDEWSNQLITRCDREAKLQLQKLYEEIVSGTWDGETSEDADIIGVSTYLTSE